MGKFDRSVCDCCVCPMQCVMQQLTDREGAVAIATTSLVNDVYVTINSADNFLAKTSREASGAIINGSYPICNVTAVGIDRARTLSDPNFDLTLKPVRVDEKGECSCCEDPATEELKSKIGKTVRVEYDGRIGTTSGGTFFNLGIIEKVGEGIVTLMNDSVGTLSHLAISTCHITKVEDYIS
ncbi:hypothetical protein [Chengkuizengella sediminis]|uniref:hypothetical protein n=1 Tax=Chengkuizengella sediminis TaxID=1885917 RepID=UPI00138A48A6|nr:hypothetical protein [Chengkuizengella sediminis]NDI33730.1 hypothetical protein [Chengkuizengella sediminis]